MIGNYCVERTIGRGQFGKVKLAYNKKMPDMKVMHLIQIISYVGPAYLLIVILREGRHQDR